MYGDLSAALRSEGKPLQQIGDQLVVTREQVRQVPNKHSPNCWLPSSPEQVATMLGKSYRRFRSTGERLIIQPAATTWQRIRWAPDVLTVVWEACKLRSCRICGWQLPSTRSVYCSEDCVREVLRNWKRSLKQKETIGSPVG